LTFLLLLFLLMSFYIKSNHIKSKQHVYRNNLIIGPSFDRLHIVVNVGKNIEISSLSGEPAEKRQRRGLKKGSHDARVIDRGKKIRLEKLPLT